MAWLAALALALLAPVTAADAAAAGGCTVPVVVRTPGGPDIELIHIDEGATEEVPVGPGRKPATVLLPLSTGLSGDVVRGADPGVLELTCGAEHLRTVLRRPGGALRPLPDVPRENFGSFALRVSIGSAEGPARVLEVERGRVRAGAPGPAMDMFQGRVPLEPGDLSITMEVRPAGRWEAAPGGAVPLVRVEGFLIAEGRAGDGTPGLFVLDLAATRSAIGSEHLPEGVTPVPMTAVEYAEGGPRLLEQGPHGAGGEIASVQGIAHLELLRLGDTTVRDLEVLVVPEMPRLHGRHVAGILGLDILARTGSIAFGYGEDGQAAPLVFDPSSPGRTPDAVLAFTRASGLLFVRGEIAGRSLPFIADTGARLSLLPPGVAREAGLSPDGEEDTLRGLDGRTHAVNTTVVPSLRIGDAIFEDQHFGVGELPVVRAMGVAGGAGILGQPFWSAFREIRVDFDEGTISLFR